MAEPAKRSGLFARLARNLGWLIGSRGFSAVASIAYLAIAARSLGPRGFGAFTVVLTYGQLIANVVQFQSFKAVIRYGALHLARERPARLGRLTGLTATLDWASGLVGALAALLLAPLATRLFHWSPGQELDAQWFAAVLLLTTGATPTGVLRLFDRFDLIAFADAVSPAIRIVGSLLVWLIAPTLAGFLIVWALAAVVQALLQWVLALRVQAVGLRLGRKPFARAVRENPRILRFLVQTNLASSLSSSTQLGILAVGSVGGAVEAGGFRLAQRLAKGITNPVETVTRALYPEFARLVAQDDHAKLRHVLLRICLIATALGAAAVLIAGPLSPLIIRVIAGPRYLFAREYLLLLLIAAAIDLAGFALEPFHNAHGRSGRVLRIRGVAAAAYLLLLACLLPPLGAVGAAIASVGAALVALLQFVASAAQILKRTNREAAAEM